MKSLIIRGGSQGLLAVLMVTFGLARTACAEEPARIAISLQDHRFDPAEIHIPSGKAVILVVTNHDSTAEEFDSSALKVEKIIAGGRYATIRLRPLAPGRFPFMGEFHPETAQGVVVSE